MKKFTVKLFASLLAATTAVSAAAMPAFAAEGSWKKDNVGWWYSYSAGGYAKSSWEKINGSWYHFNASGYMQTGWIKDAGYWYYLTASGAMKTGWLKDGSDWYYLHASGAMATGWVASGSKWYYMDASGRMVTDTLLKLADGTYYLDENGVMAVGNVMVDGELCTFDASGRQIAASPEELPDVGTEETMPQVNYDLPDGWTDMFTENGAGILLREDFLLTGEGSNIMIVPVEMDEMTEEELAAFKALFNDPKEYAENKEVHEEMVVGLSDDYGMENVTVVGVVNEDTAGEAAVTFLVGGTVTEDGTTVEMLVSHTQLLFDDALVIVQLAAEADDFDAYEDDLEKILKSIEVE